jgi:UDP:flavonoid glycosyltransferase YjiC (YdhE family)
MPLAHDQLDNALRVAALGVGVWLHGRRPQAAAISRRLSQLLDVPDVLAACARISGKMTIADPFRATCELIEAQGGKFYDKRGFSRRDRR